MDFLKLLDFGFLLQFKSMSSVIFITKSKGNGLFSAQTKKYGY